MIQLIQGDITKAHVDAIVNAANGGLLGGGGVDGAIHKAAGPSLLEACRQLPKRNGVRCETGQAKITPAGDLSAKFVIHTVGPIYSSCANPVELLRSCYINSLNLAIENGCQSIAFPAVSCGVYGYPLQEAADIALDVCNSTPFIVLDIQFYLYDKKTLLIWQQAFEALG